jgi:hypothetical protein
MSSLVNGPLSYRLKQKDWRGIFWNWIPVGAVTVVLLWWTGVI